MTWANFLQLQLLRLLQGPVLTSSADVPDVSKLDRPTRRGSAADLGTAVGTPVHTHEIIGKTFNGDEPNVSGALHSRKGWSRASLVTAPASLLPTNNTVPVRQGFSNLPWTHSAILMDRNEWRRKIPIELARLAGSSIPEIAASPYVNSASPAQKPLAECLENDGANCCMRGGHRGLGVAERRPAFPFSSPDRSSGPGRRARNLWA